jgi:mRNA interferase YafQ
MLTPVRTTQFKRDVKLAEKRGKKISLLKSIMADLIEEKTLPAKHKDHKLSGDYARHRECHIEPDWLLIYRLVSKEIHFVRTGTHSDLFSK